MEIRPLREDDDRAGFTCGDADLDRFFTKYAGQNQFKHHIGTTYVAVEDNTVWGYATISVGHIAVEELPERLRKRLPRYPVPILRLARLAVATQGQGRGIGGDLLYAVFKLALSLAESVGCFGVVVDAKPQAIGWYERYGFIPLTALEGISPARPTPTPMFLSLTTIQAAADVPADQAPSGG